MIKSANDARHCLKALGQAWRMDWAAFDGRTLRDQLDDVVRVLDGEHDSAWFLNEWSIRADENGCYHWQ